MLTRLIFAVAAVAFGCLLPGFCQTPQGWYVRAISNYRGSQTIYVTPALAHLISQDLCTICRANGTVTVYNPATKLYMDIPHDKFIAKWGLKVDRAHMTITKGETSTRWGLKLTKYTIVGKDSHGSPVYTDTVWTTNDIPLALNIQDVCAAVLGIPNGIGIALEMTRTYPAENLTNTFLNTVECRRAAFPQQYLQIPPGYKPTQDEGVLFMGNKGGAAAAASPRAVHR